MLARLSLLLLAALVCAPGALAQMPAAALVNGDLELSDGGGIAGWKLEMAPNATARWEPTGGVGGSACASIELSAPGTGDVAWSQDLQLEPFGAYIVRGSIRGDGIRQAVGGEDQGEVPGPGIATSMWMSDTVRNKQGVKAVGDFDWTPFALDVATTRDGRLTVSLRFGRGGMVGKAYFDDITVEPNPDTERFEGRHLVLNLYKDEVEMATRAGVEQAIRNTDILCEAYAELTGDPLPDDLRLTAWAPKLWDIGALGWSSDPVEWVVIPDVLRDNWHIEGFCPEVLLHEYAHIFDRGRWSFDGHFSELFMYYACETRNLGICEDSGFRRGAAVRDRWEIRGKEGVPNVCTIIRKAIALRDQVGWEPFKRTYRWFQALDRTPIGGASLATYPDGQAGGIRREVWHGLRIDSVADLSRSPRLTEAPDIDETLPTFEVTQPPLEGYGERLSGFLLPPETGDYTLWVSSDDASELCLSTDEDPANKRRIAFVEGYCEPREALRPEQQSDPVHLEQGHRYYVEVLHTDTGGGSHVSVAWSPRPEDRISPEQSAQLNTRWGKCELYFDKLSEFSGADAWSVFTPEEKDILRWVYTERPEPTLRPDQVPAETKTVALSGTGWESAKVGWMRPARDATPDDMPLRSETAAHFSGLYAHAPSSYVFRLGGKWTGLTGLYHLQKGSAGSVVFVVRGDGEELFRSDLVTDASERTLDLDVSGVNELELVAEDGGNGRSSDWAVWTETKLTR